MNWIEANGASLRYELSGVGPQTLVLLHELGGALESWDESMPELRKEFRVLRYDQRGFGLSEKIRGALTLEMMLADLCGLLDGLGIDEPCHVVGTALGAGVAVGFAARHPDRVARLIASNVAVGTTGDRRQQVLDRAEAVERDGMRPVSESSLDRSYPDILRGNRERFETYRLRWLGNSPDGFAAINRMLATMDLSGDYAKVACPTLVIAGKHDALRPPEAVRSIADMLPNARFVEADSGHFTPVQSPELFLELALPFLKGA